VIINFTVFGNQLWNSANPLRGEQHEEYIVLTVPPVGSLLGIIAFEAIRLPLHLVIQTSLSELDANANANANTFNAKAPMIHQTRPAE
jgi:hypothetical protein